MNKLTHDQAQAQLEKRLIELEIQKHEVSRLADIAREADAARDAARDQMGKLEKAVNEAQAELDAYAEKAVMVRKFRHHGDERITVAIAKRTLAAIFVRPIGVHGAKLIQFRLAKRGRPVWREYPEPSMFYRIPVELEPTEGGKL